MKNNEKKRAERLVNALSLADDKYVAEASPDAVFNVKTAKIKHKMPNIKRIVLLAASISLLFAITLTLVLIPLMKKDDPVSRLPIIDPESADKTQLSNDYSDLLEKLAAYKDKNDSTIDLPTADGWWVEEDSVDDEASDKAETMAPIGGEIPPTNNDATPDETYEETTDNQTDGVIEADIIKRSNKYIYYFGVGSQTLRVYSIAGESSALLGSFSLESVRNSEMLVDAPQYFSGSEFFLTEDCKSVIFITRGYVYSGNYAQRTKPMTYIISLDVSDPQNITLKNTVSICGSYVEARYADGRILLVTSYYLRTSAIDLEKAETFLPQINGECIDSECVLAPDELDNVYYTVLSLLDIKTLEVCDNLAYISYACNDIYASEDNLYIWRSGTEVISDDLKCTESRTFTEISSVSYSDGKLEHNGAVTVSGQIRDQYCLDEYNGVLRVFTSTHEMRYERYTVDEIPASYKTLPSDVGFDRNYAYQGVHVYYFANENANLYCIRVKDFEFVAEVVAFAPDDENVKSARFEGDTAYVCTSVDFSDPVFFFDLSDLENITYKDTGTIEGYSTSLIDLGDGLLLGIGYGENRSIFKLEIYREGDNGVESVSVYEEQANFALEYKSYMIDRKEKLIGVPIYRDGVFYNGGFMLFSYESGTLEEAGFISIGEHKYGYLDHYRALCIDGYLYAFADDGLFTVKKLG